MENLDVSIGDASIAGAGNEQRELHGRVWDDPVRGGYVTNLHRHGLRVGISDAYDHHGAIV